MVHITNSAAPYLKPYFFFFDEIPQTLFQCKTRNLLVNLLNMHLQLPVKLLYPYSKT
jgi:hypothetical protein